MAADEKTEKATPKRRQDERKKGNVFQSHDVVTVLTMLVSFNALKLLSPQMYENITRCMESFFGYASDVSVINPDNIGEMLTNGLILFFLTVIPILMVGIVGSVVATGIQTRMLFSADAFKFKGNRINPLQGFKRLFSVRSIVEVLKALIKISVLGIMLYQQIEDRIREFPRLMDGSAIGAVTFIGDTIVSLVNTLGIIFLFLALFDYLYQWWDYEKNLRMSKQEIKEEYKQTEGDPQIKGKIKEKQQRMANMRMMQKVPEADVIIRNPTHYAVALAYDPENNMAPMVVAKGADKIALKIVEIGEENGLYIVENKPLARGLYDSVEVDMEIPSKYYEVIAGILAFAYELKNKKL